MNQNPNVNPPQGAATNRPATSANIPNLGRRIAKRLLRTARAGASSIGAEARERWLDVKYQARALQQNAESRRLFVSHPPALGEEQRRVLNDLKTRGIAFSTIDELLGDAALWGSISHMAATFSQSEPVTTAVSHYRETFNKSVRWEKKMYLVRQHPEKPELALDDPLLRFALHDRLLPVVNSYLEMWSKLYYADSWYTIPVEADRPLKASQNWHRDHEDKRIVKAWLYYTDVDEGSGAMQYVPGSRRSGGKYSHLWRKRSQLYPPPGALEATVPSEDRLLCCGRPGALVLCDTTGWHRGGYATTRSRIFSTWTYVTPAATGERRFAVARHCGGARLGPEAEFAIA